MKERSTSGAERLTYGTYLALEELLAIPHDVLERDVTLGYEPSDTVRAALLRAYADEGTEAALCERMVDLDEGVMEWRYRHVQMVRRMIGSKPGTAGSAGVDYLASTLMQPAFSDLWAVRGEIG